ncbi:MAG: hybrid sensor histidine kinase/response regulator [Nitrospinae bacterium]|nr:hybrid sensor histidine kinase/response regulator [Nitrospinota bacterium]
MTNTSSEEIRPRVLLVDDTPENLDILRKALDREGYEISIVSSGELALEVVPKFKPDLILLDIMMPGMDGYETCRQLKKNPRTSDIPIIFITAKIEADDVVQAFQTGGADYVTKPFQHKEVCARVRTQLELRSLMKQKENLIKDLGEKNERLVELDDLKNRFLGMAAHDLRNPLATIKGFSTLLIDADDSFPKEEQEDFLKTIKSVSEHMLTLVNDLLDYSVIESGNLNIEKELGSMKDLVIERIRVNQFLAEPKGISIQKSLCDLPEFEFDRNRIIQVLDNLIGNAVKFSPKGSTVHVSARLQEGQVRVTVKDEGPGISVEDQKLLFEGFQKLSARPTGGEKSTGLGLAIVKKMTEAHGGTLSVDSRLGEGSEFSFTLPMST